MCRRVQGRRAPRLAPRSSDRYVVSGIWKKRGKVPCQRRVGAPFLAPFDEGVPRHRPWPRGQRHQFGHRAAAHGHSEMLACLNPPEHPADVVSEITSRNVRHGNSVAVLLHADPPTTGCCSPRSGGAWILIVAGSPPPFLSGAFQGPNSPPHPPPRPP